LVPDEPTLAENGAEAEAGPVRGLFRSLGNLVATLVGVAHTRLELLSTELQREMHRVAEILVWTLVALLCAGIGLFLLALAIIVIFWDTHRVLAAVLVTGAFFGFAAIAGFVLRAKLRAKPRLIDATLTELAKDRDSLAARSR
jgi:uncharacterized membrane protein YqjE